MGAKRFEDIRDEVYRKVSKDQPKPTKVEGATFERDPSGKDVDPVDPNWWNEGPKPYGPNATLGTSNAPVPMNPSPDVGPMGAGKDRPSPEADLSQPLVLSDKTIGPAEMARVNRQTQPQWPAQNEAEPIYAGGGAAPGAAGAGGGGGGGTKDTSEVEVHRGIPLGQAYQDARAQQNYWGEVSTRGHAVVNQLENQAKAQIANQKVADLAVYQAAENNLAMRHAEAMDAAERKINDATNELLASKVDPERHWKSKGALGQVATVISLALGGFAQGFSGGKVPNIAWQMLQHAIDTDIEAQKSDIVAKRSSAEAMNGMYGRMLQRFGNEDSALHAAKAQYLEATAAMLDKRMAEIGAGPGAQAGFAALQQKLYEQKAEEIQKARQIEGDKYIEKVQEQTKTGGGGGVGGAGNGLSPLGKRGEEHLAHISDKIGQLGLEPFESALDMVEADAAAGRGNQAVNIAVGRAGSGAAGLITSMATQHFASDSDLTAARHINDAQAQLLKVRSGTAVNEKEYERQSNQLIYGSPQQRLEAARYFRKISRDARAGVYAIDPNAARHYEVNQSQMNQGRPIRMRGLFPGMGEQSAQPQQQQQQAAPKVDFRAK